MGIHHTCKHTSVCTRYVLGSCVYHFDYTADITADACTLRYQFVTLRDHHDNQHGVGYDYTASWSELVRRQWDIQGEVGRCS